MGALTSQRNRSVSEKKLGLMPKSRQLCLGWVLMASYNPSGGAVRLSDPLIEKCNHSRVVAQRARKSGTQLDPLKGSRQVDMGTAATETAVRRCVHTAPLGAMRCVIAFQELVGKHLSSQSTSLTNTRMPGRLRETYAAST